MGVLRSYLKYFLGSSVFAVLALGAAFFLGYGWEGTVEGGLGALLTALMLGLLETSLSFDNAVVNAKILGPMTPFWRTMFVTLGMVVAVFGMRVVFPLLLVWLVSQLPLMQVITMTWNDPLRFQTILLDQHLMIAGFGGAFLWMVFTQFFFDPAKKDHWIPGVEKALARCGRIESVSALVALGVALAVYCGLPDHRAEFLLASVLGIVVFLFVEGLGTLMHNPRLAAGTGLGAFLYLEILDASFSFDGVIGAFAITDDLYLIGLGLGIGAFFVRSMTIQMVEQKTLATLRYLEHGAFWAIGALACIMDLGALGFEVPELVSGSVGLVFIGLSFGSSLWDRRRSS